MFTGLKHIVDYQVSNSNSDLEFFGKTAVTHYIIQFLYCLIHGLKPNDILSVWVNLTGILKFGFGYKK